MRPDASTIFEAFKFGSTLSEGGPCLGFRTTQLVPFHWLTYNETMLRAKNFGSGLLTLGIHPGNNTRLAVLSRWVVYRDVYYEFTYDYNFLSEIVPSG